MKTILTMISAGLLFLATACEKNSNQEMRPADIAPATTASDNTSAGKGDVPIASATNGAGASLGVSSIINFNPNDIRLEKSVYFNSALFNVVLKPSVYVAPDAVSTLSFVPTVNTMYVVKAIPGTVSNTLLPVISALPGREFSSGQLWRVVVLTYMDQNARPFQLYSNEEITRLLLTNKVISAQPLDTYYQMRMSLADQPASTK